MAANDIGRRLFHSDADASGSKYDYLIPYHGWFMTVAFAGIFPAGVLLPLMFKGSRAWRQLLWVHGLIQLVGALFVAAGLGLGAKLALEGSAKHVHRAIGIAVFTLVWLQVIAALASRQLLMGKTKGLYNLLHRWAGATAVIVGIGNAFYGMSISAPATRFIAGFGAAIGGWLLIAVCGQLIMHATCLFDRNGRVVIIPKSGNGATDHSTYRHVRAMLFEEWGDSDRTA